MFIIKIAGIAIGVILLLLLMATGYVKAPPDKALIISGLGKLRILIGKSGFRIPFFERKDELSLKVMSIDVKTGAAVPTNDYMSVTVDGIVKAQISSEKEGLARAAKNFLNQDTDYIITQITDVLEGNMREIVGQMKLTDMVQDRKKFGELVQENAKPDLEKLGLDIVSFNIQNFITSDGIIEKLGEDNTSKIRKEAAIAKARADKEIAIAQAQAMKEANDEKVKAEREIAEKQNELSIKKAELKQEADLKQADADIAYDLQSESRRKEKEEKIAEANLVKEQKQIEIEKARLDAERKQQADVELYERQREAEAKLFEEQKQAEAIKIKAEKEAEAIKIKAKAEAESKKAVGLAEAEAIKAKAIAEAEGIDKKAEAMKKYGDAAKLEMYFKAMPEIAKNIASPLNNVDKITMYGDGNNSRLVGDITKSVTQVMSGLNESLGVNVEDLMKNFVENKMKPENKEIIEVKKVEKLATPPAPKNPKN